MAAKVVTMGKSKRTGHVRGPGGTSKYRNVNRSGVGTNVVFGMLTRYSEEHCDICRRVFYNELQLLMHNTRHLVVPLERLPLELTICSEENLDESLTSIEEDEDVIPLKDLLAKGDADLEEPTYIGDEEEYVSLKKLFRKDRVMGDLITGCKVDLVQSILPVHSSPVNQTARKMAPASQSQTMAPVNQSEEILTNLIAECKVNLFDDLAMNVKSKVFEIDDDIIQLSDDDDEMHDKANTPTLSNKLVEQSKTQELSNNLVEQSNNLVEQSKTHELSNKLVEPLRTPALLNKLVEPCEVNVELLKLTEGLVVPYDTLKRRIPYRCNLCNLVFESRYTAVVHQMTHIELKIEPDTCVNCFVRYVRNCRTGLCDVCSLQTSLADYYGNTSPCPKCCRRFVCEAKMLEHMTSHTDKFSTENVQSSMTSPVKKYLGTTNLSTEFGLKSSQSKQNSRNKNLLYFEDLLEEIESGNNAENITESTKVDPLSTNDTPVEPVANALELATKTNFKSAKQKLKVFGKGNAMSKFKRIKEDAKRLSSFARKTYAHTKHPPKISTATAIETYEHKRTGIETHISDAIVTVIPTHKPYVKIPENKGMPPKIYVTPATQSDLEELTKALTDATKPLLLDVNRPSAQISIPSAMETSSHDKNTGPVNDIDSPMENNEVPLVTKRSNDTNTVSKAARENIEVPLAIECSNVTNAVSKTAREITKVPLATESASDTNATFKEANNGALAAKNTSDNIIKETKQKKPTQAIKNGDKKPKRQLKKLKEVKVTKDSEHMQVCDICYMFLKNTSRASYSSNKKTVYKIICEAPDTGAMHACEKCGSLCREIKVIEKITKHPFIPFMMPIKRSLASRIRFEGDTEEKKSSDVKKCLSNAKRLKNIRNRIKELNSRINSKTK